MKAVNLIPDDQRSDVALGGGRSGGGAYAVLGLLAGLTILLLVYAIAHHDVSSRKAQLASISAREQQVNASAGQLSAYTDFISTRNQRTQAVTQLAESRFAWAHALYELGRVLPLGVSITSLSGQVGNASTSTAASPAAASRSVSSATPPGSIPSFILSGCATSQNMVATTLNRLSLIHGVSEVALQASTTQGGSSGAAGGSSSGGGCPKGAPSFTVQVTYQPLPDGVTSPAASSGGASGPSDASNSTLQRAQSTGGAG